MKLIVLIITVFLLTSGNNSTALASNLMPGSDKERVRSKQGENNVPIKTVTCDWVSFSVDAAKLAEDNAVKLALYKAVVTRRGVVQAKKACATIEGDPVPIYALAKGGKIKITKDYSRDRHLKLRGLLKIFWRDSYTTRKVEIGYIDQDRFIPLNSVTASNDRRLFLRLKGKEYF